MRPSWEEYCLILAQAAKLRSEDIHRRVGACALDSSNKVLGTAYNGLAPGKDVVPEFWCDRDARRPYCIHAEQNLSTLIKRGEAKIIAVTTLPCDYCAGLICAYSIPHVVYSEDYPTSDLTKKIFQFYGVTLKQITEEELAKYK